VVGLDGMRRHLRALLKGRRWDLKPFKDLSKVEHRRMEKDEFILWTAIWTVYMNAVNYE
jgi:hypothetical protein